MRTLLLVCLLGIAALTRAQQYDAQWVLGSKTSTVDFRNNTVKLDSIAGIIPFFLTSACISDEQGDLLYVCDGDIITDRNGDTSNGTNLSPCDYTTQNQEGFAIVQAALFLPEPDNSRNYYLIHFSNDSLNDTRPGTLYYSLIDKEGNNGLGAVIQKNKPILTRHLLREGGMTACKHANGRDYWVVIAASGINRFYKFLITPNGILGPYTQDIGPEYPLPNDNAYSKFSQDGSKYLTGTIEGLILVMDFDRCSGEFSRPVTIYNNGSSDPIHNPLSGIASAEFSPNNRFVYATNSLVLNQYDLWSSNIQDSVAIYQVSNSDFYKMCFLQNVPNGKIYISTFSGGLSALHVINNPDEYGDSADFVYGGQPTYSANSFNIPNMINYRLGLLVGSGCDTITEIKPLAANSELLRIQPNPADKYVYIEMGMQGEYTFALMNTKGQLMATKETKQVDVFDTEHLPAGTYFLSVKDKTTNTEIAAKKVVVVH